MIKNLYISLLLIFLVTVSLRALDSSLQFQDSSNTHNTIYDNKVQLTFGLFLPSINSTAQINAETGRIGTIINLETAFSLPESQNLFRMNGLFRIDNKHSLEGYYYALNRSGSNVSKDSLVFGDIILRVNSSFNAFFNATLYGGKYRYSIFNGNSVEAGFSAGLSFLDLGVGAEVTFQNSTASDEYNDLLFLPVLGFYNRVNIIETLIFRSNIDMFALDIGKYDGVLFDFGVSVEYLPYQLFSIGISYNVFSLNINFNTSQTGKILYSHKGFMFFGKVYFN
jgi:hypothetical protein